jgi:hypothetical protein
VAAMSASGAASSGRLSHSRTALYISLVVLHIKYTGWRRNDFGAHGQAPPSALMPSAAVAPHPLPRVVRVGLLVISL